MSYFKSQKKEHFAKFKASYTFPVVFDYNDDGISVSFPDLPGVFTYGHNEEQAFKNAKEAVGLHIFGIERDFEKVPLPSKITQINLEPNQVVTIVNVYMPLIRNRVQTLFY
ncbi:type II toxin-antitoxin system HicB family antitoxin [Bacillus sp. UNC438CL73TsuS30]|uniref:type II toxin-antitoxin system HicB family antitoxin n=1 Tax=Bacillus sp. UNC438CL73TsuS30 TaxID=1340434 RepID=UPI0006898688|nr:type II toxin-antitoxin system HicB family antitoxin [Bacillus sp. UNC438CL73TsuS30]